MEIYYFALLAALYFSEGEIAAKEMKMKMVHLLYRHGARSPLQIYPKSQHQAKDWPDGLRRLTQLGMEQEYKLGLFLKERYINNTSFLSQPYIPTQVYIRSSDSERCLQSALSQLAGLYPPSGHQIWKSDLLWQPVPVHTTPKGNDPLLRPQDSEKICPRLVKLHERKHKSKEYIDLITQNKKLFLEVTNYTGMEINDTNLWRVTDQIICEEARGWAKPKWAIPLWKQMKDLSYSLFIDLYKGNDEIPRLTGGPLLDKINKNMEEFSGGKDKLYKMNIFSGHDTSLLALASALDVDIKVPTFASCLMIEMFYSSDTDYVVEMRYRTDFGKVLQLVKLKECEFSCPLNKFLKLTRKRRSINRDRECHMGADETDVYTLKALLVTFVILSTLFLLIIVGLVYYKRSYFVERYKGRHEVQLTDNAES